MAKLLIDFCKIVCLRRQRLFRNGNGNLAKNIDSYSRDHYGQRYASLMSTTMCMYCSVLVCLKIDWCLPMFVSHAIDSRSTTPYSRGISGVDGKEMRGANVERGSLPGQVANGIPPDTLPVVVVSVDIEGTSWIDDLAFSVKLQTGSLLRACIVWPYVQIRFDYGCPVGTTMFLLL